MRRLHAISPLLLATVLGACSSLEPTRPEPEPNQPPPAAITPDTNPPQGRAATAPLPGQAQAAPAPGSVPAQRVRTLRDAQQRLRDLGYDPGTIDGVAGQRTMTALRAFQKDQGLRPTGRMDSPTREALGAAR